MQRTTLMFLPIFFFFNDTATTEIYTLSLHDALPISARGHVGDGVAPLSGGASLQAGADDEHRGPRHRLAGTHHPRDRKSTRLNSSHGYISYAVFCLKKKKQKNTIQPHKTVMCSECRD